MTTISSCQIFDYMNVQSIHNATFLASCPPTVLARARALANYHEAGIFSSTNGSDIKNGKYALFLFVHMN